MASLIRRHQMFYKALERSTNLLKAKIPRDSISWAIASRARRLGEELYHKNSLNQRRWSANRQRFERAIAEHEKRGPLFFIQVGACDGVMSDPIFDRVRQGRWSGILVEPQRFEFERLKLNYASEVDRLIFENVAIAEKNRTRTLYRVKEDCIEADWQRGIASFFPLSGIDPSRLATDTVQCITFVDLLQRHRVEHIDLLQVDVEGYDYEILKIAHIENCRPDLIRYEHRHLSLSDAEECRLYLRRNGYEVLPMQYDTGAIRRT
ncbi:MAG: FkbM family methyltransferase [Candidatus Micrarchaeaceae archaeon]